MGWRTNSELWYNANMPEVPDIKDIQSYRSTLEDWLSHRLRPHLRRYLSPEDIASEVMLEAVAKRKLLPNDPLRLRDWLRQAALHTLLDMERDLRRKKRDWRRRVYISGSSGIRVCASFRSAVPSPSSVESRNEAIAALRRSLKDLSPDQARALELHHLHGLTIDATAEQMDRTVPAIQGLLRRGMDAIRRKMRYAGRFFSDDATPKLKDEP